MKELNATKALEALRGMQVSADDIATVGSFAELDVDSRLELLLRSQRRLYELFSEKLNILEVLLIQYATGVERMP